MGEHRFGFNGMEMDDEVAGTGNSYTAPYWQYDPRLGRRWNQDPVEYPWQSPYATFNNNPIYYIDPMGLEGQPRGIGEFFRALGEKIGNIFRKGFGNKRYHIRPKGIDLNINWQGLGNFLRGGINLGPPAGRMVNQGWSDWRSGEVSTDLSAPRIDRRNGVNLYRRMRRRSGESRVTMTGLEVRGRAPGGSLLRVTGGRGQGSQRPLFASSGLQNAINPSSIWWLSQRGRDEGPSPVPKDYFEARAGMVPGLNNLPWLLANSSAGGAAATENPTATQQALEVANALWMANTFNHKPPMIGEVWSLRFRGGGGPGVDGTISYRYRYRWSAWESWDDIENKSMFTRMWHWLMWGSAKTKQD